MQGLRGAVGARLKGSLSRRLAPDAWLPPGGSL
jgi:hypothetical protein